ALAAASLSLVLAPPLLRTARPQEGEDLLEPEAAEGGDELLGGDEAPGAGAAPRRGDARATEAAPGAQAAPAAAAPADDPHAFMLRELYPSAKKCGECHVQIYEEWSVSNHAYASISPVFHKFEQTINDLTRGTIDTFCMRCHASVSMALGEPREAPLWE